MRQQTVLETHLVQRNLLVRAGDLLQILVARHHRIQVRLRRAGLQQVQDDLRVFGSFLSHVSYIASRVRATGREEMNRS